jgi:hypothetical protein
VLHALHRTPEEDRRRTFGREQEEEEGRQGRGDLLGRSLEWERRMPLTLYSATVTRFGRCWVRLMMAA